MNLLEFPVEFSDEQSCKDKWKEYRDKQGVTCIKCGCKEHYWKRDKENYECKKCGCRQSFKANTVMHNSQLPFRYWLFAIHLLTTTKKSFSALEVQRQLKHSNYNSIWAMLHKLRIAMGKRDEKYTISGTIELDDGFFTVKTKRDVPLKRGRGSQRQAKVLVMAESSPSNNPKYTKEYHKKRSVGFIKMLVIEDLKSLTIDAKIKSYINKESDIDSDNSSSYSNIHTLIKQHRPKVIAKTDVGEMLPWVHIAISNAKRQLLNTFHCVEPEYLQSYLDEFCYKFNRRYFGENLFDRLMIASVSSKNEFRYNVKKAA